MQEQYQKMIQGMSDRLQRLEALPPTVAPAPAAPAPAAAAPAPTTLAAPAGGAPSLVELARPHEPFALYERRGGGQLLFDMGVTGDFAGSFTSKKVEQVGDRKFKVTGDLTIHGVTREVVLDVEGSPVAVKDPSGNLRLGGVATTKINRTDFGLQWNRALETGGVLVGDEVAVTVDVELIKKGQPATAASSSSMSAD